MEQASYRRRQSVSTGFPTPLTRAYSADKLDTASPQYPPAFAYSEPVTPPCSASQYQSVLFPNIKSQILSSGPTMQGNPPFPDEAITPTSISSNMNIEQGYPVPYNSGPNIQPNAYRTHSRSYSYSPNDIALAMNRVSLDGGGLSPAFPSGVSPSSVPSHRPRALSSGVFDFLENYESWNRPLIQQHSSQPQAPRPQLATRSSQASLLSHASSNSSASAQSQYLASPFSLSRSSTQATFAQPPLASPMANAGQESAYLYISPNRTTQIPIQPDSSASSAEFCEPTLQPNTPTTPPSAEVFERPMPAPLRRKSTSDCIGSHLRSKSASSAETASVGLSQPISSQGSQKPKAPVRPPSSGNISGMSGSNSSKIQEKKSLDSFSLSEIYALCRDQRGCRLLQRRLQENNPALVSKIFEATHKHMTTLMSDPFGNYFCQKLVEYCSDEQLTSILETIAPQMKAIALNQHGTRALQRAIEVLRLPSQISIVTSALDGAVVELIRDLNGNHVVQKILLEFDETGSQFIYDAVCDNIIEVGSHRHGCCVLQRCIDYASPRNREKLVSEIVANTRTLVCDPFGNYVCQYVITLESTEYNNALGEQMLGSIAALSVQKFSSNVVEKCLRAASTELAEKIVHEIIQSRTLHTLLLDSYGNYVIQTALDSCSGETRRELAETIQLALKSTRSPYGRRIMSKLKE